tara:strand:+ start:139 stop:366 length:228 start_codon:yes stop_codon:yes gene_type:complete
MAQATARKKDIADDPTRLWVGLCGGEGRAHRRKRVLAMDEIAPTNGRKLSSFQYLVFFVPLKTHPNTSYEEPCNC